MSANMRGALLALLAFGIYSTHDVVVKFLGAHYHAVQIIFFAQLLSFPLVTLMMMRDRTDGHLRPRHPGWMAVRAACTVVTGVAAFYAFSVLPLAQTYALLFATPLLITLLAIPVLGEKVGIRRGLAVVAGLIGVLIVLRPGAEPLSAGHIAGVIAAISSALGSVVVRRIGKHERSVVMLLYPMMASFLVLGAILPLVYKPMPVGHLGMLGIIAGFGLVGMILTIAAYRDAEAVIVAPMQYSQMIWAVIYGALIFGETPDRWTVAGAGVIIASGLYIVLREGHARVSENRPVLAARGRPETGPTLR